VASHGLLWYQACYRLLDDPRHGLAQAGIRKTVPLEKSETRATTYVETDSQQEVERELPWQCQRDS
jgi:hypothetical protein